MMAASDGRQVVSWNGKISVDPGTNDAVNSQIYRLFNRVDEEDGERLEKLGYRLPSLSAGDVLVWGDQGFSVKSIGFENLKDSRFERAFN